MMSFGSSSPAMFPGHQRRLYISCVQFELRWFHFLHVGIPIRHHDKLSRERSLHYAAQLTWATNAHTNSHKKRKFTDYHECNQLPTGFCADFLCIYTVSLLWPTLCVQCILCQGEAVHARAVPQWRKAIRKSMKSRTISTFPLCSHHNFLPISLAPENFFKQSAFIAKLSSLSP